MNSDKNKEEILDDILLIDADFSEINEFASEDESNVSEERINAVNEEVTHIEDKNIENRNHNVDFIHVKDSNYNNNTVVANEFIWIKFFKKGKLPCSDLKMEIFDYMIKKNNLNVNGLFFRDDLDVLVEVQVNSSLKSFLICIYEERLGSKVLKKKSIRNIVNICDGKFSVVIGNQIMCLVIAHNYDLYYLPCKSTVSGFGLSNGEIINIYTEYFYVDQRFSVYEAFLLIQEELLHNMKFLVGMRLERGEEDVNEGWIRFSISQSNLNIDILKTLKKFFSVIHFSGVTMHLLLNSKAENIVAAHNELCFNGDMKIVANNDLIYPKLTL